MACLTISPQSMQDNCKILISKKETLVTNKALEADEWVKEVYSKCNGKKNQWLDMGHFLKINAYIRIKTTEKRRKSRSGYEAEDDGARRCNGATAEMEEKTAGIQALGLRNQGRQDPSTQRTGVQRALGRREVGVQTEKTEMVTLDVGNGGIGNKGGEEDKPDTALCKGKAKMVAQTTNNVVIKDPSTSGVVKHMEPHTDSSSSEADEGEFFDEASIVSFFDNEEGLLIEQLEKEYEEQERDQKMRLDDGLEGVASLLGMDVHESNMNVNSKGILAMPDEGHMTHDSTHTEDVATMGNSILKVSVQLGVEERTELAPYCVLMCLTLEGKLVLFHVASLAGREASPKVVAELPDKATDALSKAPGEECSTSSRGSQKQELEEVPFRLPFEDMKRNEISPLGFDDTSNENDRQASEVSKYFESRRPANSYTICHNDDITKSQKVESVANLQSLKPDEQLIVPHVNLNQKSDGQNPCPSLELNTKLGQFSSFSSPEQFSQTGTQKTGGLESSTGSLTVKSPAASGLLSYYNLRETPERTNELLNKNGLWHSPIAASHQSTGEKFSLTNDSDVAFFSTVNDDDNHQIRAHQYQIYDVGDGNVNAAKGHASLGQMPFHVEDIDGVIPAVNYACRTVQSEEQKACSGAENIERLSVCSSQVPSNEISTIAKSPVHKFRASSEQHRASSMIGISTSEPNLSKQFGNIHEMTKELDLLLRSIEETGGFRDTCTRSLLSAVEALEQGMDSLSANCKAWMYQVVEQLEEVHRLLDKTLQVVARKMYMEGVFKQASDSRYWDLWNRQKLNSELELKQLHILSLNQNLTNQLIELERHFNVLEFNKFSEYGGTIVGHGAIRSRYRPSRYIQSLYSVHNTMNSQLVAAENLSESLSKQMAALSVKSSSEEQKNVKKELFEIIGIPYEPSFGSPDMKNVTNTPSSKKALFDSIINKDPSKKIQPTAFKGCEPEMSRRRRDSLDQSWTCFEPPKTIVRRMLLQEAKRPNFNRSFFSMDKENIGLSMLKKSPHQTDSRIPATIVPEFEKKGTQVSHPQEVSEPKAFIWANNLSPPTQLSEFKSPVLQRSTVSAFPSKPASHLSPGIKHCHFKKNQDLAAEKYNIGVQKFDPILNGETKPMVQMKIPQKSCISNNSPTPSMLIKSSEMSVSDGKTSMFTGSTTESKPSSTINPVTWRKQDFPFSASLTTAASTLHGSFTHFNNDKSQPGEKLSAAPTFGGSSESPSPTIQTSSVFPLSSSLSLPLATMPSAADSVNSSKSLISSNASQAMSTSSASGSPSPFVPLVLSNAATTQVVPSFPYSSSVNSNLEALKSEVQQVVISNLKTDLEAAKEASPTSSPVPFSVPTGELFRPASFTFPSSQSSAPAHSTNSGAFSCGFSAGTSVSSATQSVFGQPAQIGSGQQALGSVLGTFGQSRQLGNGLPGSGFAASGGFGGGFAVSSSAGGFSSASTGGGFAGIASAAGGFAGGGFSGIASTFGGFAGNASAGGGFATVSSAGGFAGATSGGFGAFSSQGSGFGAFGTAGANSKPPEFFTQMRK
ncbi:Nuclear pore complex protein NUP214 [Senna tora]|uniref:Nuclear pore complex protein NUP214 n=1 Tax=Senna tora TaxID=362788 RepID=A0A834X3J4_9FABA|nr:Nuclear pore complex protein NUP214 [Senna tora]